MATLGDPLTFAPLHPCLGVEVQDVDLTRPVPDETFARLVDAFNEHSVLVFPDQPLTDDQQVAFSVRFGPLEKTITSVVRRPLRDEIADLSNVDAEDAIIPAADRRLVYHSANQMWHSDSSFKRVPAMASLLSGREVPPEGGETEFASMRVAYAALSPEVRARLDGKVAIHSFVYSRGLIAPDLVTPEHEAKVPPVPQALVRRNPVHGRPGIFIGSHAREIVGMPVEEGRTLLQDLLEVTTRPDRVYRHRWRPHDLLMWDNRCVLHRGRPWDVVRHRRVMHRTTVAGDGPTA